MEYLRIVSKDVKKGKGKVVFKHNLRSKNVELKILIDNANQIPENMPVIEVIDSNSVRLRMPMEDVVGVWHITAKKGEQNVNK